ncbi:hypothetical protein GCM10027406_27240 [Leifsonia lichenia]
MSTRSIHNESSARPQRFHGALRAVAALVVLVLVTATFTLLAPVDRADATVPGSPGTPQPGTVVYTEDFENNTGPSATNFANYVGATGAAYTGSPFWINGARCNGVILNYSQATTPAFALSGTSAADSGVNGRCSDSPGVRSYQFLRMLARGMGQQFTPGSPTTDNVVSSYTECQSSATAGGTCDVLPTGSTVASGSVLFRTVQPIATSLNHYYVFGVDSAYINCGAAASDPGYQFQTIDPATGTATNLGSALDGCATTSDPNVRTFTQSVTSNVGGAFGTVTKVVRINSMTTTQAFKAAGASMGLQMYNTNGVTNGNDGAFDNLRLVDVTPQLDKSFSPALIAPGGVSTLTFTITNTDEINAKNDWNFADTLPAGVVIAPTPAIGGTCAQTAGTAPFVRTGVAGSNVFTVTGGDLANNQASCTVTVAVTSAAEGSYVNGPANVVTNLNPPGSTTLTVRAPRIELSKALGAPRQSDTDQFTTQLRVGGPTGTVVNDTTASTTTGGGATVDPGTGTTGSVVATEGTAYTLTEVAAGTTVLASYASTITCTDTFGLQPGLPTNAPFTGSLTLTPVAGADIHCTLSNTAQPILDLTKQGTGVTGPDAAGDYSAHYTVTVANSSSVPGTFGPLVDTPAFAPNLAVTGASWTVSGAGAPPGGSATGAGPFSLAPGGSAIAARTAFVYAVDVQFHYTDTTQAVDCAGPGTGLYNSASVTGETGGTGDNAACLAAPAPPAPGIALIKTASTNDLTVGTTIMYTFVATNTGNVGLSAIQLVDHDFTGAGTLSPISGCAPALGSTLAPGATLTCSATYVVQQADVDTGIVSNAATVTGTPPVGPAVTASSTTNVPGTESPGLVLQKLADASAVTAPATVGQTVTYRFTATNTGDVTLHSVGITDDLAGISSLVSVWPGTTGILAPGQSVTATATYEITQADIDAGHVANSATAAGIAPDLTPIPSNPSSTDTPLTSGPALAITKTVDSSSVSNPAVVGEVVVYTITATNTGNVTLTDVTVADPLVGITPLIAAWPGTPGTLAPGESVTVTTSYAITQADIDSGHIANSATVVGSPPTGPPVAPPPATTETPLTPGPALTFTKAADTSALSTPPGAGDTVTYRFTATNSGNVTLTDVTITDALSGLSTLTYDWPTPASPGVLTPGETVTASATYTLTAADVDAGHVANTATVVGTPPAGTPVMPPPAGTDTPLPSAPALTLAKVADTSALSAAPVVGETVTYRFTVTNTGNVTLTSVTIADALAGLSTLTYTWPAPASPGVLAAHETATATATYQLTQADVDAGTVQNAATATGTPPTGGPVTTPPVSVDTPLPGISSLTLTKVADVTGLTDPVSAGQTIEYTFAATNTGTVTLTGVTIADPLAGLTALTYTWPTPTPGLLAPGQTVTATGAYTLTQADVDAGAVTNTATATGTPPSGPPVTAPPASTDTPLAAAPSIGLVKTADTSALSTPVQVGDTIRYSLTATNTGNVTLTGVDIADPLVGLPALALVWPGVVGTLTPGQSVTGTAAYTLTQTDVDAGSVTNTATATGTPPTGQTVTTPPVTVVTPLVESPALTLTKAADASGVSNPAAVAQSIMFEFTVTNTGNVALRDVAIDDPLAGLSAIAYAWPAGPGELEPGESVTATATYRLTQADLDAGRVSNTAFASGVSPGGAAVTSEPSTVTVAVPAPPVQPGPPAPPASGLPPTGSDIAALLSCGVLLVGIGAYLARRRKGVWAR